MEAQIVAKELLLQQNSCTRAVRVCVVQILSAEAGGGWVDYTWALEGTHQDTSAKKMAYIMPFEFKTQKLSSKNGTMRYYLGILLEKLVPRCIFPRATRG